MYCPKKKNVNWSSQHVGSWRDLLVYSQLVTPAWPVNECWSHSYRFLSRFSILNQEAQGRWISTAEADAHVHNLSLNVIIPSFNSFKYVWCSWDEWHFNFSCGNLEALSEKNYQPFVLFLWLEHKAPYPQQLAFLFGLTVMTLEGLLLCKVSITCLLT